MFTAQKPASHEGVSTGEKIKCGTWRLFGGFDPVLNTAALGQQNTFVSPAVKGTELWIMGERWSKIIEIMCRPGQFAIGLTFGCQTWPLKYIFNICCISFYYNLEEEEEARESIRSDAICNLTTRCH